MRYFLILAAAVCISFTATAGSVLDGSSSTSIRRSAAQAQYLAAWHKAMTATHHADAVHLTFLLAAQIGLPPGETHDALEKLIDRELASNPGRFAEADPNEALGQLLRENVRDFQRLLSPVLPEASYSRYTALLDKYRIRA